MGLDIVELVIAVEDAFQIHIPDGEAGTVETVGDLYALVLSKLDTRGAQQTADDPAGGTLAHDFVKPGHGPRRRSEEEIWDSLCRVIVEQTGVKREEIRKDARLVEDLRLD